MARHAIEAVVVHCLRQAVDETPTVFRHLVALPIAAVGARTAVLGTVLAGLADFGRALFVPAYGASAAVFRTRAAGFAALCRADVVPAPFGGVAGAVVAAQAVRGAVCICDALDAGAGEEAAAVVDRRQVHGQGLAARFPLRALRVVHAVVDGRDSSIGAQVDAAADEEQEAEREGESDQRLLGRATGHLLSLFE